MTKNEILQEIIGANMVDDILEELVKLVLNQKTEYKMLCKERKASLKAIGKIADGTGDIEAIRVLCEES